MKRIYLLPNIITAFGLSCGLFAIFKTSMIETGAATYQTLVASAGILLLAAFADLLDGAVARAMKAESDFGGLFDCLADAITFGVAPSIIVLKSLSAFPGTAMSFFLTTAAMVYSVCGVLRLVRFSIIAQKAKDDNVLRDANKKNFTGLPIPAAAAAIVSSNLILVSDELLGLFTISQSARSWLMIFVLIVIGYLMICRLKFPSFKSLRVRVASFQLVFFTVICAVILFYGLLHHFAVVFFAGSWAYVIVALILSLIRFINGKKSKTLEDFEPEPEEDLDLEDQ